MITQLYRLDRRGDVTSSHERVRFLFLDLTSMKTLRRLVMFPQGCVLYSCFRGDQSLTDCEDNCLGTTLDAELGQDMTNMRLHRILSNLQIRCNFFVGFSLRQQVQNLRLTVCQRRGLYWLL